MDGITILAEQKLEVFGFNSAMLWITVPIFVAIGVVLGIRICLDCFAELRDRVIFTAFMAMIGLLAGLIIGTPIATIVPTGYETVYKVTIDESVSATEFLARYEIIEQQGQIFTIREKEQ